MTINNQELSEADKFAMLPESDRNRILETLSEEQLRELAYSWKWWGRPKQLLCLDDDWSVFFLGAARGWGKAVNPLEPILTENKGWIKFGELEINDIVYTELGTTAKVLDIYDTPNPNKTYRLHFSDETSIEVCSEHRWATWTASDKWKYYRKFPRQPLPKDWINYKLPNGKILGTEKTTQEIVETFKVGKRQDLNHCIPLTQPLNFKERKDVSSYYYYGLYLGDGMSDSGNICGAIGDLVEYRDYLYSKGFYCYIKQSKHKHNFGFLIVPELKKELKNKGLLDKFSIPKHIFTGSIEERIELLKGFADADGTVGNNGQVELSNTNKLVVDEMYELLYSLGLRPHLCSRITKYVYKGEKKTGKVSHRIRFFPLVETNILKRKVERQKFNGSQFKRLQTRMITKFEEIEPYPMKCIRVDSPNTSFLVGKGLIPTLNSHAACQWVVHKARTHPGCNIAVVGATAGIVNRTVVNGPGGIMEIVRPGEARHLRGDAIIKFENGSVINLYSAAEPARLRGPNHHYSLADDIVAWKYPETYHMLKFTTRIGKNPQLLVTTSPAATPLILSILSNNSENESEIEKAVSEFNSHEYLKKGKFVFVRGTTFENTHLPPVILEEYKRAYPPTSILGQQELYGKIVLKVDGALWERTWFQYHQNVSTDLDTKGELLPEPTYVKTVLAVDPAVSVNKNSDYTAITVSSKTSDGRYYVRYSKRFKTTPGTWAEEVVRLYHKYKCDKIIAEANNGGLLVEETLRSQKGFKLDGHMYEIDGKSLPIELIHAKQGKYVRATPVAFLYEDRRVWHLETHTELEAQMLAFKGEPNDSDDLVDSLVYTLLDLSGAKIVPTSPPMVGGYRAINELSFL